MEFRIVGKYGAVDCYKCTQLLDKYNFRYEYINIDDIDNKKINNKIFNNMNIDNIKSFPLIFINDHFLGNFSELYRYITLDHWK